MTRHNQQDATL